MCLNDSNCGRFSDFSVNSMAHSANRKPSAEARKEFSVGRLHFGKLCTVPSFSNFVIKFRTVCRSGKLLRSLIFIAVPKALIAASMHAFIVFVKTFHEEDTFFNIGHA